jgi:hypothetical protein
MADPKPWDIPAAAARLDRVEKRLDALDPPEGGDLTAVEAGLNRLYEFLLRGSQRSADFEPITYTMEDSQFWFGDTEPYRSVVSVTYGNEDQLDRVADVPLIAQTIGVSSAWDFASLDAEDQDAKSLAGSIYYNPGNLNTIRSRSGSLVGELGVLALSTQNVIPDHGNILRAMYGSSYATDPDASTRSLLWIIRDLGSKLADAIDRIQWLEDNT